jgi:hypothetical protein
MRKELIGVRIAKDVYLHVQADALERRHKFAHDHSMPQTREIGIAMRAGDQQARHGIQRGI